MHGSANHSQRDLLWLTTSSILTTGLLLLIRHPEGAICLVMALPLAMPLALFDAWVTNRILANARSPRAGVGYPEPVHIVGHGVGVVRYCRFSTGPFVEPIRVWDETRLLRFTVTSNPEPLRELTPYKSVHPPHLNGYFVSRQGQFLLQPLPNDHTLLGGTT